MRMGWLFGVVGLLTFAVAKPAAAQVSIGGSVGASGSTETAPKAAVKTNESTTATTTTTTTTTTTAPAGQATTPPATEGGEVGEKVEGKEGEEEEPTSYLSFEMVIGSGKQDVVTEQLPGVTPTTPSYTPSKSLMTTESFMIAGGFDVTKHIELGMRLPFTHGAIFVPDSSTRNAFALGNIELEVAGKGKLSQNLELVFGIGVALPTAQGTDAPEEPNINNFQQSDVDRAAVNRMAAASRGWEDNALFETNRTGIIPKLQLLYHADKLAIEPYVKLENLIATSGNLEKDYIGELVLGGRVAYRVANPLTLGIRAWANLALAHDPGVTSIFAVEPELRVHVGNVEPFAGVILPVAGSSLTEPYNFGVRLGVAARF